MRIFDPHIHTNSRTTDDYRMMRAAGVRAVVEPACWVGQPRTCEGTFVDYFDTLLGWEPLRAAEFGVAHHCALGLNPREANDQRCAPVLSILPRYLVKDHVVAVGHTGFEAITPAEERAFVRQLELAREHELPVLVRTPSQDPVRGAARTLDLLAASGIDPTLVLVDHLTELTVRQVHEAGYWKGFTVYPDTGTDPSRMVRLLREFGTERTLVSSAADWAAGDPLATWATGAAMLAAGFEARVLDRLLWDNPVAFYRRSGRLELLPTEGRTRPADRRPAIGWGAR
jgi:predicted metal-dependent TIM-barrel fold hydrolase